MDAGIRLENKGSRFLPLDLNPLAQSFKYMACPSDSDWSFQCLSESTQEGSATLGWTKPG